MFLINWRNPLACSGPFPQFNIHQIVFLISFLDLLLHHLKITFQSLQLLLLVPQLLFIFQVLLFLFVYHALTFLFELIDVFKLQFCDRGISHRCGIHDLSCLALGAWEDAVVFEAHAGHDLVADFAKLVSYRFGWLGRIDNHLIDLDIMVLAFL